MIAHYDQQTEEDAAAEIETAHETAGETWICVPTEFIGVVARLIEDQCEKRDTRPIPQSQEEGRDEKGSQE